MTVEEVMSKRIPILERAEALDILRSEVRQLRKMLDNARECYDCPHVIRYREALTEISHMDDKCDNRPCCCKYASWKAEEALHGKEE